MFIADLHIHSAWSRATSKTSTLPGLFAWAGVKGINLVATGDFTHPAWRAHLNENLVPAEEGLYRLKVEKQPPALAGVTPATEKIRFLLSSEISSIYKKDGRVRKIHNIIYVPSLADAAAISARLAAIGNIESDGRPILGLDARDLLEIVLTESEHGFMVPAHVWTPWFSLFGSKSGFDRLEDCFGDLAEHIFALETGLSSDPEMNRLVSALDRYTLISNSDCHSTGKLGREANIFSCPLDFHAIKQALKAPEQGLAATIEFFPEEGKYHLDGHRKCGVSLEPRQSAALGNICPQCGRPLTIGVLSRVWELADREEPLFPKNAPGVHSLIPLPEVLAEILSCGPATKKVGKLYSQLIGRFGSEFNILLKAPDEELATVSPLLAEAIKRMRTGKVIRHGGFDGEFGVIRVFEEKERERLAGQSFLFGVTVPKKKKSARKSAEKIEQHPDTPAEEPDPSKIKNPSQESAISCPEPRIMVIAGPGTGKTHTLVGRILHLVCKEKTDPESIFAITFTNRAADEMRERLAANLGQEAEKIFTGTFHRFCLFWLRKRFPGLTVQGQDAPGPGAEDGESIELDRIIPLFLEVIEQDSAFAAQVRGRVKQLLVDEFQDAGPEQVRLIKRLAESCAIFLIGDPNQAIYSFRGVRREDFFSFISDESTRVIQLENHYRSKPEIIKAAGGLIGRDRENIPALRPIRPTGGLVEQLECPGAEAEAESIVSRIEELVGGVGSFSIYSGRSDGSGECAFEDIAILCRLSRQFAPIAGALERRGLPVQLIGEKPFFNRPPLKAISDFIRWAKSPDAKELLALALLGLPGVGSRSVAEVIGGEIVSSRASEAMDRLDTMREEWLGKDSGDLRGAIAKIFDLYQIEGSEPAARRFSDLVAAFQDPAGLLDHMKGLAKQSIYDPRARGIAVMTIHAAKGLDFKAVFIPGLDRGIIPWSGSDDREEERRLLYVAMTRATDRLILTNKSKSPSPFLDEIPQGLVKRVKPYRSEKKKNPQLRLF